MACRIIIKWSSAALGLSIKPNKAIARQKNEGCGLHFFCRSKSLEALPLRLNEAEKLCRLAGLGAPLFLQVIEI